MDHLIMICTRSFDSNNWIERKAAAEVIKSLSHRQDIDRYEDALKALLEPNKFDKVQDSMLVIN